MEKAVKTKIKSEGMTSSNYRELARLTLAQLVFFNRRRPREVEVLLIDDFCTQMKNKQPVQDEVAKALSLSEKLAMKRLDVLMVRGKRGRGVPILLTENTKESIEMIVVYHKEQKHKAKYVFARVSLDATTPLRAGDTIRELADAAGLKHPENLRCTKLRKHIATLSQLLGLKDHELEQLANHMGHNIAVHREYYRLPQETMLLAKMSKLLCLTEKGQVHQHCGESLDEISINS
ncbi:uncharacterized protein [Apostichopus japonicus]|uniref:uncharacterized protein n=1 Tax=Stichopus japonicus TaxID=307972 RepID=UPI003AB16A0E